MKGVMQKEERIWVETEEGRSGKTEIHGQDWLLDKTHKLLQSKEEAEGRMKEKYQFNVKFPNMSPVRLGSTLVVLLQKE
jgi:hypothetical protein